MDIAKGSWHECTQCYQKPPTQQPSLHYEICRMARTCKSKKMTNAPLDFWDDIDKGAPPSTTSGGSTDVADATMSGGGSGGITAMATKKGSNLNEIAPLFFTNSRGDGDPFVTTMRIKVIQTMAAIFAVGSYNASSLYSAFGE